MEKLANFAISMAMLATIVGLFPAILASQLGQKKSFWRITFWWITWGVRPAIKGAWKHQAKPSLKKLGNAISVIATTVVIVALLVIALQSLFTHP